MSEFDIIHDSSLQNLKEVPLKILQMCNLRMLYLQQNFIKEIPRNLFKHLPQLTWLDLRHNHITTIPLEIAFHKYLENLLLSDNKISALPNELGTLPQLKVLQIANNPLSYPHGKVISEGTKGIVTYLKQQYQKTSSHGPLEPLHQTKEDTQSMKELKSEKEIRVVTDYVNDYFPSQDSRDSSLMVKGLSKVKRVDSDGITHKLSTSSNKILIRSYYGEDDKYIRVSTQTSDSMSFAPTSKQSWIEKLKDLLDQQEKILQQERLHSLSAVMAKFKNHISRNLQALSSWRVEKRKQRSDADALAYKSSPPYATDPQYTTMLSREDIHKEIDRMIERSKNPPRKMDVEKLISDLVSQLKEMENSYGNGETPTSEIEAAGAQITKIMEMHKKILELHDANNMLLQ